MWNWRKAAAFRAPSDCLMPSVRQEALYSLKSMDGVIPKFGIGAVRIDSDIMTLPKGQRRAARKVPAAPNGRYVGLVLLFSSENGEPLAILPDGVMQRIRVGATNGLGVKYLARRPPEHRPPRLGWQAGTQLMAACAVRRSTIRCFSPNREPGVRTEMSAAQCRGHSGRSARRRNQRRRHRHVRHQHHGQYFFRVLDRAGNASELDQKSRDRNEGAAARRPRGDPHARHRRDGGEHANCESATDFEGKPALPATCSI